MRAPRSQAKAKDAALARVAARYRGTSQGCEARAREMKPLLGCLTHP
jgi:hypothetical protein